MILTVNIENAVISVGCSIGSRVLFTEETAADRSRTELDHLLLFQEILNLHGISAGEIEGGIISSVVPALTDAVKAAFQRLCGKRFLVVGPGLKTGLSILMDNPAQVGNDLAVSAVAALEKYSAPLLVVSLGTANCICVINEKKQYIGSIIMPGMRVALEALRHHAAQLPDISIDPPKKLVGNNTVQSMKSGILYGTAASIDGMIARIEEDQNMHFTVLMTGEYAEKVAGFCRTDNIRLEETLLMDGLRIIYEKNQKHAENV